MHHPAFIAVRILTVAGLLWVAPGLQAAEPASPADTAAVQGELRVFPEAIRLDGKDSRQQILVSIPKDERSLDVTRAAQYTVSPAGIVQVDSSGVVTPLASGTARIHIAADGMSHTLPVEVLRGETFLPIDFSRDIVSILTRRGCNGGGCHGKATGRGGFCLSLFGYNPAADYESITREAAGRRISPHNASESLLLQKPSMTIAHGGGRRLGRSEPEFQRIARWIESNAPRALPEEIGPAPALVRLDLHPQIVSLRPGDRQQFAATAFYADGSTRDVTRLVEFRSSAAPIAEVDQWGLATAKDRVGAAGITAMFAGQVAVSQLRVPLDLDWSEPDFQVRNFIDELVLDRLKSLRIPPSDVSADAVFLRRASQQIAGRLPTPEELSAFTADPSSDKRLRLVRRLLNDPGYADHFAQKWSSVLRNKRRGQNARKPGTIAFHRWIRNAIAANVPYDRLVRGILTATGKVDVNPPVQWYAEVRYLDRYVDDTAQVFLGTRIGCARCHHHPFENISQEDYYGLAAFFGRVGRKGGSGVAERRANEEIYVKPSGSVKHPVTGEVIPPHGLGGPELEIAPFEDPRSRLVDWMTEPDNPYFARAFVNRMWAHFFGRGLVDPLDDLRVTNPASNEPLLDALARQFIDSGFDMKHIVELICSSTTYQLSSTPNEHNLEEMQNFSRFYPQRLKAEVLLDAIDQVTGVATSYRGLPKGTRALQLPDEDYSNEFLTLFGRPPRESACECERAAEPSLSQSLFVMNDGFILGKVTARGSLAARLAGDDRPPADKVRELFVTALSREPTERELADALGYLASEPEPKTAFGNLTWALLNTKEFLYVH